MDATLHDLGGILLKAIPTLILLLIVHLYLKRMFFGPMRDVLAKRREATEGAIKSAEMLLAKASEKAEAIEVSLRKAREEIYQEQEEARRSSRDLIHQAKQQLDAETAAAKRDLTATTAALADQIAQSLMEGKAA